MCVRVCGGCVEGPSAGPPSAGPPSSGPPSAGPPKISLFFSLSRHSFLFFPPSLVGPFRCNFDGVFEDQDPQMCTFGLFGCRVKPRRPHQTGPPGLAHDKKKNRELQTCTFEGPGASNTTKIPRKRPKEMGKRNKQLWREREKKARNFGPPPFGPPPFGPPPFGPPPFGPPPFGAPPFGAPPFGAPPFGAPPFGAPQLRALTFSGFGPPPFGAPPFGAPPFGAPPFGAPPFGAPPFGATPFGATPFGAPTFSVWPPTLPTMTP